MMYKSKRIDYLKAKINLETVAKEQENFFKSKLAKIAMIDEKMNIAQDDFKLYNALLDVIVEEEKCRA